MAMAPFPFSALYAPSPLAARPSSQYGSFDRFGPGHRRPNDRTASASTIPSGLPSQSVFLGAHRHPLPEQYGFFPRFKRGVDHVTHGARLPFETPEYIQQQVCVPDRTKRSILERLPPELLLMLAKHLKYEDALALTTASKRIRSVIIPAKDCRVQAKTAFVLQAERFAQHQMWKPVIPNRGPLVRARPYKGKPYFGPSLGCFRCFVVKPPGSFSFAQANTNGRKPRGRNSSKRFCRECAYQSLRRAAIANLAKARKARLEKLKAQKSLAAASGHGSGPATEA